MNLLSRLKREGVLLLHHDYRAGHLYDMSGNGKHGTPSGNLRLQRDGVDFDGTTGVITCGSDNIGTSDFTVFVLLGVKGKGGGNYGMPFVNDYIFSFFINFTLCTRYGFAGGILTSPNSVTIGDYLTYAATCVASTRLITPYIDGLANGTPGISTSSAAPGTILRVGNTSSLANGWNGVISAVIVVGRVLTPAEVSELDAEVRSAKWDNRAVITEVDSSYDRYATHLGAGAMVTTSNITAGYLPGMPFQVSSGTFKTVVDTVNGKPAKVIECVAAGMIYAKWNDLRNTHADAAYGTWEWFVRKADASVMNVAFVAASGSTLTAGDYVFEFDASENLAIVEQGVGDVISGGTAAANVWHSVRVTRSPAGAFELIVDGSSEGTGSDATTTEAGYFLADMDAGDKIAIAYLDGAPLFSKYWG